MFPEVKAEGNIEGQGETKLTVCLWGQSLNVLLYLPIKKTTTINCSVSVMVKKKNALDVAGHKFAVVSRCTI